MLYKKYEYTWVPTSLKSRTICCFFAQPLSEPNWWEHVSNLCQERGVESWELKHKNGQQKVLYTAVDIKKIGTGTIRRFALRSNLIWHAHVAYPSEALNSQIEVALHKAHFYKMSEVYVGTVSENNPGVYLFFEDEHVHPLYIGQTKSLSTRFLSRMQNKKDAIPNYLQWVFRNAASPEDLDLRRWSLRFIPLEQAQAFAVQGQLAPDLDSNSEARLRLETRYQNSKWALDAAESALIAHFSPHFNTGKNTYPDLLPLLRQEYCQQHCRACDIRRNGIHRKIEIS